MTPEEQTQQIRELKVEARACMGAASRMLDPSANDLRASQVADSIGWLESAMDMLRHLAIVVEQRAADEREREMKRRHAQLTQRDPLGAMADAKIGLRADGVEACR